MRDNPPFPTSIKVGWKRFRVQVWSPEVAAANHRYGECDHVEATIRVDLSKGPLQAAETLIHECLHAALDVGASTAREPDAAKYDEESIVRFLASWTMTLFVDNPALAAYVAWATSQED